MCIGVSILDTADGAGNAAVLRSSGVMADAGLGRPKVKSRNKSTGDIILRITVRQSVSSVCHFAACIKLIEETVVNMMYRKLLQQAALEKGNTIISWILKKKKKSSQTMWLLPQRIHTFSCSCVHSYIFLKKVK